MAINSHSYVEAAPVLTSHNVVNIQTQFVEQLQAVAGLRNLLPKPSFEAIRFLEISFCCSNIERQTHDLENGSFFEYWTQMCATVEDMRVLSSLHIWMNIDQGEPTGNVLSTAEEAKILTPLLGAEWFRLKYFQVEVSWPATTQSDRLLQEAPFTLVRMQNPESPFILPQGEKMANLV